MLSSMSLDKNIGQYFVDAKNSIAVAIKLDLQKTAFGISSDHRRVQPLNRTMQETVPEMNA
jgi:hypothetical protein